VQILRAMSVEAKLGALALLTAFALVSPLLIGHTSQTVVNPYEARVVIHNDTPRSIHYMLRWGNSGEWKAVTLNNGTFQWHGYKLGPDDRAPAPYIRFHNAAEGYTEYKLEFGKFCHSAQGKMDDSMHYEFAFDGHRRLELYKQ
jgi:hypothetical protein